MNTGGMAKVAAVQFETGTDVDENLATCLRMIDQAALQQPDIVVLPEFCNHLSWYDDDDHAWRVAVPEGGEFLAAVAARAARHQCYIVINVSCQRTAPAITVTSFLFGPDGSTVSQSDKQTLMGHENDYFVRADSVSPVVVTPFGQLGIFPCRDGVTCETPRGLALRGAQLFCDSLNSFALDEASLHIPARAPENKVFLVAANKVGPLIPRPLLEPVSEATRIPLKFLMGAGESQIVAPDGSILAKGPLDEEAVVIAEINLADSNSKLRPDGTDLFLSRRPELYSDIVKAPEGEYCGPAAETAEVAIINPQADGEAAIAEVIEAIALLNDDIQLVVLPELFCFANALVTDVEQAVQLSVSAIAQLQQACSGALHIATTLVEQHATGTAHTGLLINSEGVVARQPQLHSIARHSWATPGDQLHTVDLSWGKVAIITGDDAVYPELIKVAALRGVHAIIVPFDLQEAWEIEFGLLSRAAENRLCVIAASRQRPQGGGVICSLERDFTILTEWKERAFDGNINYPIITLQAKDTIVTTATIHPNAAANKVMSANTDLLQQRPWQLSGRLVE
ncbi:hypothetical protein BST96_11055 [Oceanicoccus sagamiensis]|uniref:CN hydrolase domain-containing protein n=2 Tax=Oceanicoccus sagamiensis TaxID=716816 RepID=A0A1X9NRG4_9GAMM|nr:hypothetical protein BST96_11055 [Oceanicoccus sagamiensis]